MLRPRAARARAQGALRNAALRARARALAALAHQAERKLGLADVAAHLAVAEAHEPGVQVVVAAGARGPERRRRRLRERLRIDVRLLARHVDQADELFARRHPPRLAGLLGHAGRLLLGSCIAHLHELAGACLAVPAQALGAAAPGEMGARVGDLLAVGGNREAALGVVRGRRQREQRKRRETGAVRGRARSCHGISCSRRAGAGREAGRL